MDYEFNLDHVEELPQVIPVHHLCIQLQQKLQSYGSAVSHRPLAYKTCESLAATCRQYLEHLQRRSEMVPLAEELAKMWNTFDRLLKKYDKRRVKQVFDQYAESQRRIKLMQTRASKNT